MASYFGNSSKLLSFLWDHESLITEAEIQDDHSDLHDHDQINKEDDTGAQDPWVKILKILKRRPLKMIRHKKE